MGLSKNERGALKFYVAGNDRNQTNEIIKKEWGAVNFIVAGNERNQTNGIL